MKKCKCGSSTRIIGGGEPIQWMVVCGGENDCGFEKDYETPEDAKREWWDDCSVLELKHPNDYRSEHKQYKNEYKLTNNKIPFLIFDALEKLKTYPDTSMKVKAYEILHRFQELINAMARLGIVARKDGLPQIYITYYNEDCNGDSILPEIHIEWMLDQMRMIFWTSDHEPKEDGWSWVGDKIFNCGYFDLHEEKIRTIGRIGEKLKGEKC